MEHAGAKGHVTGQLGIEGDGTATPYKVLLIEDSSSDATLVRQTLQDDPLGSRFIITACSSLEEGFKASSQGEFGVVLLDLNLPDSKGFATFEKTSRSIGHLPIIVLTSAGGEELALRAVEQGAQDFIFKDRLDPYWTPHTIRHAVGRHRLLQRVKIAEAREVEAAKSANQAKTDFLAAMSHEIRTPIGAILMASGILLDDSPNAEERKEYTEIIHRNGEHLLALVSDVLDLSKVEAGRLAVEEIPTALTETIEDVLATLRPVAASKLLAIGAEYSSSLPALFSCDPTRFRQILNNLVGNAIKFTDQGSITIRATTDRSKFRNAELVIAVEDSGKGVDPDHVKNLFRPFSQADASVHRQHGGTGLGLVLSRRLAAVLGGRLELTKSQLGIGSTFTLFLPLKVCCDVDRANHLAMHTPKHERPKGTSRPTPLSGIDVLFVEDNPDNQYLYGGILERAGADISFAADGVEGLEQALQSKYDIIIMDMQMPRMDGPTAVRNLRRLGYRRPILALTADGLSFSRDRCLEAGCNGYLLKPITASALIDAVRLRLTERTVVHLPPTSSI